MIRSYLKLPRVVHILCLGTLVNRAGTFVVLFLTTYLQREMHWSPEDATRAFGVFGLGALGALIVGGHLADRWGRRLIMLLSLGGAAVSLCAFSLATSTWAILVLLWLFSFVGEMYRPAAAAMIADVTPLEQRPQAFALMYVAINLGFAIAAPVGGEISEWSFQWLFWGDAATSAIYAVLIGLTVSETLHMARGVPASAASASGGHKAAREVAGQEAPDGFVDAVRVILADRVFLLYWLGTLCLSSMFMQSMAALPLHLTAQGFSTKDYGRIIGVNGLLIVLLQLPITAWVSRFPRSVMVPVSSLITGLGFALTAGATTGGEHVLAVVVWTCGEIMNAPLMSAIIGDLAPPRFRARYMGAFSMCFSLAIAIMVPCGGWVLGHFGGRVLWWGCAGMGLLSALLYFLAARGSDIEHHAAIHDQPGSA